MDEALAHILQLFYRTVCRAMSVGRLISGGGVRKRTALRCSNGSGKFSRRNGAGVVRSGTVEARAAVWETSPLGSSRLARSTTGRAKIGNGIG